MSINKTKIAVDIFDKYADLYQDKYMDVSLYHDAYDIFCDHVKKENADILELACGPGNITQYLLKKRPDFKILGTDLAPKMLDLAKINNPTADFQLMDCRDINKLDKKYEGIMCGFCLPYLSKEDAIKLIHDAADQLMDDGIIYISTMEDDYNKSGYKKGSQGDEIYMHFHEAGYLTEALLENGFTIIDIQRKVYPASDGTVTTDLVLVAGKY